MSTESKITVKRICDEIGRKTIADALGVGVTSVSNFVVENKFPAKAFLVVQSLCRPQGLDCPEHLFSFVELKPAEAAE